MINNSDKKALSTVVTTLIIILLVFVAIGIVWVVVKNVVDTGAGQIDVGAKCISSSVKATSVSCTGSTCTVILKRDLGNDEIGGVKLIFSDSTNSLTTATPIDVSAATYTQLNSALSSATVNGVNSGVTVPDKVEVTIYYKDSNGEDKLCGSSNPYSF